MKEIFQIAIAALVLTVTSGRADGQDAALVRVFVDCNECDSDYLREQLTFVNLVRDRLLADVGVMITSLPTASGGRAYSVELLAVRSARATGDTITVNIAPDATPTERRQAIGRAIKIGLIPFVRHTAPGQRLDVTYAPATTTSSGSRGEHDPWRQWVFRVSGSGSFAGDDNYSAAGGDGEFGASRVTDHIRAEISARGSYNRERFRLAEGGTLVSERRGWSMKTLVVTSLDDHFSLGMTGNLNSSVFENTRFQVRAMPAIEYDVFPYREATQRQFIIRYSAGVRATRYVDTTIYQRIAEARPSHELAAVADIRRPWGALWGSSAWSQYLHDRSKRRLSMNAGVDWRIIAGLSFNISGYYSMIRDQLNIPGGDLSNEERLLRLRELQSGYSASLGVGLSYTFGSVFSNVVNPRFRL